jgi:hypothetical protein
MTLAIDTRRAQLLRGMRRAGPYALLAAVAVVVWWAGVWLLPIALFAVAAWRAPDPERVRFAVELFAAALVLVLTAVAVLIQCARGRVE